MARSLPIVLALTLAVVKAAMRTRPAGMLVRVPGTGVPLSQVVPLRTFAEAYWVLQIGKPAPAEWKG